MKTHEILAQELSRQGAGTLFGLMGDANMWIIDDLVRRQGVTFIPVFREDAAVSAADAWARITGGVGVCTVTQGPGLTNTVTALVEAVRHGTPLVLVVGDTAAADPGNQQNIDHRAVAALAGAALQQVTSAASAAAEVARAFRAARVERRPVILNIPVDIQKSDAVAQVGCPAKEPISARSVDHDMVDDVVGVLASCRRPLLIAGRGAVEADARGEVVGLARRLGAPLATTLLAKDWFAGEPDNLGVFGTLSSSVAGEAVADADCLVFIGASVNDFTTAGGVLLDGKAVVHVDHRPDALGWRASDRCVLGDARAVASALSARLDEIEHVPASFGALVARRIASWSGADEIVDHSGSETIDMRVATQRLDAMISTDRVVVCDTGHFVLAPLTYLAVPHPSRLVWMGDFAAIGLGFGAAIGAATARSNATTVLAVGDGGAMGTLLELRTAVNLGHDLVVIVYNDGSYGAEAHHFLRHGRDPGLSMLDVPSFADVAESIGAVGCTVRCVGDLDMADQLLRDRRGPVLIELMLDPTQRIGFYD